MERIGDLFGQRMKPPTRTRTTERGDLFDQILSRINPDRVRQGCKPINHKRLGWLLTGILTKDLYALISKCNDAERHNFPLGRNLLERNYP